MSNTTFKHSGVEWLGEIPKHWEVVKGKRLHKCPKILNVNNSCKEVLSLTLRGVVDNDIENPEGLIPKDYATYQIFEKDDLVFKLIDLENISTSRVGLVHKRGIMSPAYIRLQISKKCHTKFIYYFYYSLYLNLVFNHIGSGVRQTLNSSDLLEIELPLPPLDEQRQIAEFLDSKCEKIAEFINKKQKLIALLKEQKIALINECVCGRYSHSLADSIPHPKPLPQGEGLIFDSPYLADGARGWVNPRDSSSQGSGEVPTKQSTKK